MKFLVYLTIIISTIWSTVAFPECSIFAFLYANIFEAMWNTIVGAYKYILPSVMWVVVLIYFYDFGMAMLNKGTPYFRELYKSTRFELFNLLAFLMVMGFIYATTASKLTNVTIDISMAGFGFMLFGNVSLFRLFKYKVGRKKYPKKAAIVLTTMSLLTSCYFLTVSFDIANGKFNLIQSIWWQITVLCYSISLYFLAKHVVFVMDKGKLEASPVLRKLFESFPVINNLYEQAAMGVELWNKQAEKERAITNSLERKRRKKHKNKKR
ncbi:hypothetical protein [Vagococcus sp. WN89Y]|uniref:hypothetical protein n=1 Tax=Vagococcus sp. WN89Y TaxID=3457258 RepID=UPI003FCEE021